MKTIKSFDGVTCYLSNELYVITTDEHPSSNYKKGNVVRLIVRQDDDYGLGRLGYHFNKEYVTVHNIEVKDCANFCGIKKSMLIRLPECVSEV